MNRYVGIGALGLVCLASGAASAFEVYGLIGQKWAKLNAASGPLGAPRSSEADTGDGQGRYNDFQNGFIYWRRGAPEAFAVYGLIGQKWNSTNRERGFGYPVTDERPGPSGGRYNHFDRNATIAWHPSTQAHVVYGLIRDEWLNRQSGLRPGDLCGYPKTDEFQQGVYRRSNFQRGYIVWRPGWSRAQAHCAVLIDHGTALNPVEE
jgi:uncharacterized protein with LGFP repeats